MPQSPSRRRAGLVVLLAVGAVGMQAVPASAAPKLRATSVATTSAKVDAGARFTVTGKVRNDARRSATALLSFRLRTADGRKTYALGGANVRGIGAGRAKAYRVRVKAPSKARLTGTRAYVLEVCVRRTRTGAAACRKAPRRLTVVGSTPVRAPAPAPTPPRAPANAPAPATAPAPIAVPPDTRVYTRGARTLNDSLFPDIGNGGYDAQRYALDLDYAIATKQLGGTATITAEATQDLSGFSFDLAHWMRVSAVTVDGTPATFAQGGDGTYKLDVTPATPIKNGSTFTVVVAYGGTQQAYVDPDGALEGWVPDTTRGAIVVAEPVGAMGWYPNNNVPFDKATYEITIGVPTASSGVPWSVVGPGLLTDKTVGAATTEFTWEEDSPTATYLIGLGIGRYAIATTTTTPAGANRPIPFTTAVDAEFVGRANIVAKLFEVPAMMDFFADFYGTPYPFSSAGGIVPLQDVAYALETQSKPIYATTTSPVDTGPDLTTIAHETAHQWFGNHTTLTQWKDIWLNEGMAEFSTWLWNARENGGVAPATIAAFQYNDPAFDWGTPPAAPPTAADIFDYDAMYRRGAMTMVWIMEVLGEAPFRALMDAYLAQPAHLYGNATTEELIALVKEKDLAARTAGGLSDRTARWTELFRQWLYVPGKPQMTAANFDSYVL